MRMLVQQYPKEALPFRYKMCRFVKGAPGWTTTTSSRPKRSKKAVRIQIMLLIGLQSTVITPMDTGIYSKHLYEQLKKAFKFSFIEIRIKQDVESFFCNDLDSVRYWIIASENRLQLRFTINSFDQIWKYIEEYFRQTYFLGFQVHAIPDFDHSLEIVVDKKSLQQFSERLQIAETGKAKLNIIFDKLSKKFACIKRHFIASPFEMMLITANENHRFKGSKRLPNLTYSLRYREKEKTWLAFEGNQLTVYFGLSFEDRFQQQNAKVYFSELADAKKHVMNAPSITLNQSELPKFLIDSFPEERKSNYSFTNGIIAVTLYGSLVKNPRTMATYLANFRSYAYYHIQASKCYLHSRLLRRIKTFQHELKLTDRESLK